MDANVGALQDNGGYTWTQAVLPTSVAYHLIPASECPAVDQRGESRPQPSTSDYCDAGAYEYSPPVSLSLLTAPITGPDSPAADLGPVQVEALDAAGLPAVSQHVMTLNLSSTAPTSDFAETPTPGVTTNVAIIPSGSTTGSFYVGDLHPGPIPVTIQGWNAITNLGTLTQTETSVTGPAYTVTPTAGNNQTVAVGNLFPTALAVNVTDITANPVDNEPVTFTITSGSATFPGGATTETVNTGLDGSATAPTLTAGTTPGPVVISVTTSQLGVTTTFDETQVVGPPTHLDVTAGDNQSATVNTNFGSDFSTTLTDEYGNPIQGDTIDYTAVSGSATFDGNTTSTPAPTTDANGNSTSGTLTAATHAGPVTVTATVVGTSLTTTFTDVTVTPGAPAIITVTSGNDQTATSDTTFPNALSATVTDTYGNPISGDSVDFLVTSGQSTFSGNSEDTEVTDGAGVAQAQPLAAGDHAGVQTVTASVDGTSLTTTFSNIVVKPPMLTFTISPFALDSAALTPAMKKQLNGAAKAIAKFGNTKVALVGYSDITGTTGENSALSLVRAKVAKAYLQLQLKALSVTGVSYTTAGDGATHFINGNGKLAGNRRVVASIS